jgi:phospholipid/cholesterol/gamma-HCH transport system permease protein
MSVAPLIVEAAEAAGRRPTLLAPSAAGPGQRWRVGGDWTVLTLREHFDEWRPRVAQAGAQAGWDLRELTRLDSAGALTLWQGWGEQRPADLLWRPEHAALFEPFLTPMAPPRRRRRPGLGLETLGLALVGFADHVVGAVALAGRLLLDLLGWLRKPASMALREVSANIYRTGAQALGITALVGFLVGLTLAYLIAKQLKVYGADVFIINIIGLAVLRELGPLLAAVIVAGRSGSSMTAQLGVMRVTQELDALSVMGISHTARLVLPKVAALALSLPLVVLWSSAWMILGGMAAARVELGLHPVTFLHALPSAVAAANLWLGWAKAAVFGALIALLACHFGLRVQPNTASLGEGVTQSVVTAITVVIVVDAIFAVVFSDVGI